MATTKEKMLEAQTLIRAGQHDKARKLLATIDHPKAREWEAKLPAAPKGRSVGQRALTVIGGAAFILIVGTAIYYFAIVSPADAARSNLLTYCSDLNRSAGNTSTYGTCSRWASGDGMEFYRDEAEACASRSDGLDSLFNQCMIDEGVNPPGVILR